MDSPSKLFDCHGYTPNRPLVKIVTLLKRILPGLVSDECTGLSASPAVFHHSAGKTVAYSSAFRYAP
jgi:hypothetical protein